MEKDQGKDGVPLNAMNVLFVYDIIRNMETKEYFVTFDLRDYTNHYCHRFWITEEFMVNLIKDMQMAKEAGFKYREMKNGFYKGADNR